MSRSLVPENGKQPQILTADLAGRLRVVMGTVRDDLAVINFLDPRQRSSVLRRMEHRFLGHHLEIVPPEVWSALVHDMSKKERVRVARALASCCFRETEEREHRLNTAGDIRRSSVDGLMGRRRIGRITGIFLKEAFEPVVE